MEEEVVNTVTNPDEVLNARHIHQKQTKCKVYIQNKKNFDGVDEKFGIITNVKTGLAMLTSPLSDEEYSHLKENSELNLFDLRRDPQTLVMNRKGVSEADALYRAQEQGLLSDLQNFRRPYNLDESNSDFVATNQNGKKEYLWRSDKL